MSHEFRYSDILVWRAHERRHYKNMTEGSDLYCLSVESREGQYLLHAITKIYWRAICTKEC